MYKESPFVNVRVESGIASIKLTRAEALNSMHTPLATALRQALEAAAQDESVRCVLLEADGRYFMAGGDVPAFVEAYQLGGQAGLNTAITELIKEAHGVIKAIRLMEKPVVAKVIGGAAGYGLSLVVACDFALTHHEAAFTTAYAGIGTSPDGGTTFFLPRMLGVKKAAELIMLSDKVTGEQAADLGVVNKSVGKEDLDAACTELLQRLVTGPTFSYGRAKQLLNQSLNSTLFEQLDAEAQSFSACGGTQDFVNAIQAFARKEKATFEGV